MTRMTDDSLLRHGLVTAVTAIAFAAALSACGDGITGQSIAQMRLSTGELELSTDNRQRQGQTANFTIESYGEADLEVESVRMSDDTADRISFAGEVLDTGCTFSASPADNDQNNDCDDGQFCDATQDQCRNATAPETPFTIQPDNDRQFDFIRLAIPEGQGLDCPNTDEVPDSVPTQYREDYCGRLIVESNAREANEYVNEQGRGVLYFQADTGSGQISISDADFTFECVVPGQSTNDTFTLTNTGDSPLTIDRLAVEIDVGPDFVDNFEITSGGSALSYPIEIAAGESRQFTLTFNAPSSATPQELDFQAYLVSDSSAVSPLSDQAIFVSSTPTGGPSIRVSDRSMSFGESTSQTLTITNEGDSNLELQSLSFPQSEDALPTAPTDHYSILNEGSNVCSGTSCNFSDNRIVQPGNSKELTVEYSTGVLDDHIVEMELSHNDEFADGYRTTCPTDGTETSTFYLLGTQQGGVGQVHPANVNFLQDAGDGQSVRKRFFVLRNVGTSAFTTDEFLWQPDPDNPPAGLFVTKGLSGSTQINQSNPVTVDSNDLQPGAVNFDPVAESCGPGEGAPSCSASAVFNGSDAIDYQISDNCGGYQLCINRYNIAPPPTVEAVITTDSETDPPEVNVGESIRLSGGDSTTSAGSIDSYAWATLDRPDDSQIFISPTEANSESLTFRPDRPGEYTIMLRVFTDQNAPAQSTLTIQATQP